MLRVRKKGTRKKGSVFVPVASWICTNSLSLSLLYVLLIRTCAFVNCVCTCIKDVPETKLSSNFFKKRTTEKETEISDLHSNHPIIRILFMFTYTLRRILFGLMIKKNCNSHTITRMESLFLSYNSSFYAFTIKF